ncbi:uncharacterized protein LOC128872800 [Hylaeus volcanicus]|uniref:uncharacterized protein LOC128872800 n=1 Tax=Hylaeus volcanicus TaxID=313075 RepID=UPI0023B7EC38|nr:uncharacterized protein LOC128872800 [Hylaeus volcanicus]
MCAANSRCRSPPRSGTPTESHADNVRFHQQHSPPHPNPYAYYPPPPPPYPPFNPYAHYSPYPQNGFYPAPYCNDVEHESKGSSWIGIILLVLLILAAVSIVFYRSLSRDTRRRLNARLPTLTQPAQGNNRVDRVL